MNRSAGLRNKLVYLAILIVMLIPLYLLGQPDSGSGDQAGGQLTQMRDAFDIAESDLGKINPASETMKLASLGMRGVAATLLWQKAHEYKVHHEWDRLSATLNNIALLQPHYEQVWEHQAHNMAYNVSAEFDDYRQRYAWVKKGTEYLTEGVELNRRAPRLVWYTGWFYGQKLGMSDEKRQFRRLFREDEPFHQEIMQQGIEVDSPEARGPDGQPDNWLVGRLWLNRGYDLVDNAGVPIRRQTPLNFYETGPKWRIQHAVAIEEEGHLDDSARSAWEFAADDWYAFGLRDIPTTSEFTIRLGGDEELRRRIRELRKDFDQLTENLRDSIRQDRIEQLGDEQRAALEMPPGERNEQQYVLATRAEVLVTPTLTEVAKAAPAEIQLTAIQLAGEIEQLERRLQKTETYRDQINYAYWQTRARAEQEDRMVAARRLVHEAEQLNDEAELDAAIEKYEQAWKLWAEIFEDYPLLVIDAASDDLMASIDRYRMAIDQEYLPDDFPLNDFVDMRLQDDPSSAEYERLQNLQRRKNAEAEQRAAVMPFDIDAAVKELRSGASDSEPSAETPAAEAAPGEEPAMEQPAAEPAPATEEPAADAAPAAEAPAEEEPAEDAAAEDAAAEAETDEQGEAEAP